LVEIPTLSSFFEEAKYFLTNSTNVGMLTFIWIGGERTGTEKEEKKNRREEKKR
jgi:hypothetical protein